MKLHYHRRPLGVEICLLVMSVGSQVLFAVLCISHAKITRYAASGLLGAKDAKVALEQTSGRQRLNIHGAIDLETGATRMIEATTIDALSSIALLIAITLMYPTKRLIHVFLDNARYHHAVLVQEWLAKLGCRIKVHYIPSYCPHLDPIERLWGLMHRHVTHNRSHPSYNDFCTICSKKKNMHFLRVEVRKTGPSSAIRLPTISA